MMGKVMEARDMLCRIVIKKHSDQAKIMGV